MGPEERPIRILHIFGVMDRGGAETRTMELMRSMNRERFRFEFVALTGRRGEFDEEIERLGSKIHYLGLTVAWPFRFISLIVRRKYGVLHSHVHYFTALLLVMGWLAQIPRRIAHFRSTGDGMGDGFLRRIRNRIFKQLILWTATDVIGVSEASLTLSVGSNWAEDDRCRVIYSGVRLEDFQKPIERDGVRREFDIPLDSVVVVHVGRQVVEKNHVRLIQIFHKMIAQIGHAHLLLAGRRDSLIESGLLKMVQSYGLEGRVHFAGLREDVGRLLSAADLMIFPSLREGLPGAVLEAAAAGLPVVASEIPGICELAGVVPGLRLCSLAQSDEEWVRICVEMLEVDEGMNQRRQVFPALFDSSHGGKQFQKLYSASTCNQSVDEYQ